jgi:hypothetical protein
MLLFIVMYWITIHFGANPKKGGNPPSESKSVNIKNLINGLLFIIKKVWLIWKTFNISNKIKIVKDKNV